jgi:hypothetical protein
LSIPEYATVLAGHGKVHSRSSDEGDKVHNRFGTEISTCCYFARFGKCGHVVDLPKEFLQQESQFIKKATSNITEMGHEIGYVDG